MTNSRDVLAKMNSQVLPEDFDSWEDGYESLDMAECKIEIRQFSIRRNDKFQTFEQGSDEDERDC